MDVGQVIDIAREWVNLQASQTPGFCGAHLMGSLNTMPKDAPFEVFRDVDMNIIARGAKQGALPLDVSYKGLILECGIAPLECYASPDTVLADPSLASNIAAPSSLADPEGILSHLQPIVAHEFARRRWVEARLQWEKATLLSDLQAASKASSPYEAIVPMWFAGIHLAGGLIVAALKPPTHRRALVLMNDLLKTHQRLDLLERALNVQGYSALERSEVEAYLQQSALAFDKAIEVKQTPSLFDFKLHPHVRPYLVQGAQQMIDEGHHREAMGWIIAFYLVALFAILNDAPPADKQHFQQGFDALLQRCGMASMEAWSVRIEQSRQLAEEVFTLADAWIAKNPEILENRA